MLYPFWGKYDEQGDPDAGRYDVYTREGRQYFQLVPLTECDFAVLPMEWTPEHDGLRRFAQEAERAGKAILAFAQGDFEEPIPLPRSYIFRSSLSLSRQAPNEFGLPAWSVDFCERYTGGCLPLREKTVPPVVSYCGYGSKWKTRLKRLLNYPPNPGEELRVRALHYLGRSSLVRTNFLLRPGYWGGAFQREPPERISAARTALRHEYVSNMIESAMSCAAAAGAIFPTACTRPYHSAGFPSWSIPTAFCRTNGTSTGGAFAYGWRVRSWSRLPGRSPRFRPACPEMLSSHCNSDAV